MPQDYKLDESDDLLITAGDFVVGESTQQHQSLLVRAKKGELRQYPKTGVGIDDFLQDDNPGDVWQEIQKQFDADGMVVRRIEIGYDESQNKIEPKVDAYYP
jgi:hypothetical protein